MFPHTYYRLGSTPVFRSRASNLALAWIGKIRRCLATEPPVLNGAASMLSDLVDFECGTHGFGTPHQARAVKPGDRFPMYHQAQSGVASSNDGPHSPKGCGRADRARGCGLIENRVAQEPYDGSQGKGESRKNVDTSYVGMGTSLAIGPAPGPGRPNCSRSHTEVMSYSYVGAQMFYLGSSGPPCPPSGRGKGYMPIGMALRQNRATGAHARSTYVYQTHY